ncbi:hypothetical protein LGH82_03175 [Mesorhizobium sp. PAMC28654]|uniref:hypothetical protein n=1 Tax=Mesorhizobium sp. PAMC28654 TaxID=2880934 RepID=UPI001D0B8BEA|nr:hypothetical protein [Mesorhizobium sp. PAMC28654]UDL90393.1 hypothetical protein LGH82_03175 [Mesorhizobium sp. PAMC28654]
MTPRARPNRTVENDKQNEDEAGDDLLDVGGDGLEFHRGGERGDGEHTAEGAQCRTSPALKTRRGRASTQVSSFPGRPSKKRLTGTSSVVAIS